MFIFVYYCSLLICHKRIEEYLGYDCCDWFWVLLFCRKFAKYRIFLIIFALQSSIKQSLQSHPIPIKPKNQLKPIRYTF